MSGGEREGCSDWLLGFLLLPCFSSCRSEMSHIPPRRSALFVRTGPQLPLTQKGEKWGPIYLNLRGVAAPVLL